MPFQDKLALHRISNLAKLGRSNAAFLQRETATRVRRDIFWLYITRILAG